MSFILFIFNSSLPPPPVIARRVVPVAKEPSLEEQIRTRCRTGKKNKERKKENKEGEGEEEEEVVSVAAAAFIQAELFTLKLVFNKWQEIG